MTDMPPYLAVKDEEKNNGQSDSENSSDVDDWDLPRSFDKPRHTEPIKGADRVEHSWRVKEKVRELYKVQECAGMQLRIEARDHNKRTCAA